MYAMLAQNNNAPDAAAILAVVVGVLILLAISLAIAIVVCVLLYGCLNRVPPQFRKMDPGLVWLNLIPLFNFVWNFFVFQRIPESYQAYFNAQGRTDVGDCGKKIGMWYAICAACSLVPCVNYVAGPASLVLLIVFLVKVMGLKNQIPESAAMG